MKLNDYEVQHYHFIIEGIQSCELIHSKLRDATLFLHQSYPDKWLLSTFLSTNNSSEALRVVKNISRVY